MTALAVTRATLTRVPRDRTALFFTVRLPVAIIVVIGVTVSGFDKFRIGLVPSPQGGPVAQELTVGRCPMAVLQGAGHWPPDGC